MVLSDITSLPLSDNCAAMTTNHCIPLPEVLSDRLDSAPSRCLNDRDCRPVVVDFTVEPALPGKALEEPSSMGVARGVVVASGQTQFYVQVSTKEGQLNAPGVTSFTKQSSLLERPMCRICHEGEELPSSCQAGALEELLSPCQCSGTLGTVHRSCLETWLSASHTSFCELCHFQFNTHRKSRPLLEWVQSPGLRRERRTLLGDLLCFLVITPLAGVSGWLCLRGALDHLSFSSRLEAVGLITLTVALFTIYLFWTLVSLRYHCRLYNEWRLTNQRVVLLLPRSPGEPSAPPSLRCPPRHKRPSKETIV